MTAFLEILFPTLISYGSGGGPKFRTSVFAADSGFEARKDDWTFTRAEYDVSHSIKTQAQMDELTAFFYIVQGRAYAFRFKDFNDFRITNQIIATADGETRSFQLVRTYHITQTESGENIQFDRRITKPAWGTVAGVSINNVAKTSPADYTVDYNKGLLTFTTNPANGDVIRVGSAEFHVPVRFDNDQLDATHEFWMTQSWPNIKLVEVRDWDEVL
jgi:uncharacterized protein (TIGR02217 family)